MSFTGSLTAPFPVDIMALELALDQQAPAKTNHQVRGASNLIS